MQAAGLVTEVYVDVVLLINFIMDFFILWASGKLLNHNIRFFRLALGALLGASYSLVVFFPEYNLLSSLAVKVLCSVMMILLAYAPLSLGRFVRTFIYLYFVSFAMGGAVIGAIYLTDNSPGYIQVWNGAAVYLGNIHYGWLSVGLGVALLLGWGGVIFIRKTWQQQNLYYSLQIDFLGRKLYAKAFLDTGNHLIDPLSGRPVIVVEAEVFRGIIPEGLLLAVAGDDEISLRNMLTQLESKWASRVRLIPFNSIGRSNGLMLGLRPDGIEITNKERVVYKNDVVIALLNRTLTKDGRYQALLNTVLLDQ